jgi:ent-kaurenoic acid hydroxylase
VQDYTAKPGTFLPFGAGSRFCPGADLTKLEISVFLHYFLLNYRLAISPFFPSTLLDLLTSKVICYFK